ncbi:uncharacterized protein TNCV_307491 [Trichonephila clavipes]|nr:uncharacterized protein TNCV_307491 [Trichonephila clavipes]
MAPHTITPAVGAVCRCKAKAGLRHSPRDSPPKNTIVITVEIESGFASLKTTWFHSVAVQFPRAWHNSKRRRQWVGVKCSTRNGRRDPKCPSAWRLRMVREDTGALNEDAICAWMAADEAVGCIRAFLMT